MMRFLSLLPLLLLGLVVPEAPPAPPAKVLFNRDVRPILSENCYRCHGPDKGQRKAGLRLDLRDSAIENNAIVPGKPDESQLILRINSDDAEVKMPPPGSHKSLTSAQKETLKRWIEQGAEYQPHWSYIPPQRPPVPTVKNAGWVRNEIDAFILARLEAEGITPSPQADWRTLVRRVSLDLIGLPPTPAQVEAVATSSTPAAAFESFVDQLLASPHYGERMAVPWLDLVRFADTVGYHGDQNVNIFPYRDYVIASFNKNKPFDLFTREQLAGDLMPSPPEVKFPSHLLVDKQGRPVAESIVDQLERTYAAPLAAQSEQQVATGFNRLNMMTREGGAQDKEYLAKYQADRVRTVAGTWLGSTMGCAECHDHKFDPFTAKDFYSLSAFFADIKQWGVYQDYSYTPNPDLKGWSNDHPWPPEMEVQSEYLKRRIRSLQAELGDVASRPARTDPGWRRRLTWVEGLYRWFKQHPTGWALPTPKVEVQNAPPPKAPAKPKATPASSKPAPAPTASRVRERPEETKPAPPPPPDSKLEEDGRIVLLGPTGRTATIRLPLQPGPVAALRLNVLPHDQHKGRLTRGGSNVVRLAARLESKGGRSTRLAFWHAEASTKQPVYRNGFESLGILGGWVLPKKAEACSSVWFFDPPFEAQEGDELTIALPATTLGCVRVGLSPFACFLAEQDTFLLCLQGGLFGQSCGGTNYGLRDQVYLRSVVEDPAVFARVKQLENQILECRGGKARTLITETRKEPLVTRVLPRGNWQDESAPVVFPAVPAFLPQPPNPEGRRLNRLDLAKWLVAPENPLTARVFVNRLWKQFFGTGLSGVLDDLGSQGEWPTHPELLDWLAVEFRESGWNVKHLVKLIVMSNAYRQSSTLRPELRERDPNNRLLAAQNPRRLEAEFVRDNALFVAGLLDKEIGGPSVFPYQPKGYYANLQFPDRDYYASKDERQWRRGLYSHWQRTFLQPMLANFDAPSREECTACRTQANTPQQALTLLNDPTFVEAARVWASHLLKDGGASDEAKLTAAYERLLARPPKSAELQSLLAFLKSQREQFQKDPAAAHKLLTVGHAPSPWFADRRELAAWTSVCRVLLNLHESITRY